MDAQTVGILGTGRMAVRIADQLVRNGHEVILGSRTAARVRKIADDLAPRAITAGNHALAMQAPFVLPAAIIRCLPCHPSGSSMVAALAIRAWWSA